MMAHNKCLSVLVIATCLMGGVMMQSEYCSLCQSHIACNNDGQFASACSPDAATVEMTPKLKTTILNIHNKNRNMVASGQLDGFDPAAKMGTMQWHPELASLAELNCKRCNVMNPHDTCRNLDEFRYAGQSCGMLFNPPEMSKYPDAEATIKDLTQSWFEEYNITGMDVINKYRSLEPRRPDNRSWGHFTQMVTDRAVWVGCGAVTFRASVVENAYAFSYCCNYAVTNMRGEPVYKTGDTASECKTGNDKKYTGLCSIDEKYDFA